MFNFWRCVYNYKVHLCFISIEGSEYIQFFASPYPAVNANLSGHWQDLINMTNLDSKVTKRKRSNQNVTDREETY